MKSPLPVASPSGLLFGVAYYPEYHLTDRVETDLDLMREAGINVIRVGESVWSTWEPRDGEFELEWLAPVLDEAHRRGIRVILGTPTYAVPPWLQVAHPEIAAERRTGEPIPWGARQETDFSHPVFRTYAERVIRAVVGRYAGHPAVIGFQVDNEPGMELFHNDHVFEEFVNRLRAQFGDVETLNREWGLTYWSHRLADWSEMWRPDGNSFPQYDLAWRRFQTELTTEFIAWQAELVREYSRADQFVTTCLQYGRPALDDERVSRALDITSGNPYYGMQDRLDATLERSQLSQWTTTGVPALFRAADRMFASKQGRYLVTETNAQSIGHSDTNFPPYPGQLKQSAYTFISRGAAMIEYWHWHTLPYGIETYWGGVLPHSLVPGRVYREVAEIGAELAAIGTTLDGFEPDADVAILWSNASRYAMQFTPPLRVDEGPDPESYEKIFDAFHRGAVEAGRQTRLLHLDQAGAIGAEALAARYPVLVAAGVYVTTDAELALLRDYVAAGGHLVVGPRTGYADEEARARVEVSPVRLADLAGVHYDEYSNLEHEVPVVATSEALHLDGTAAARLWIDGLIVDDADVLARHVHLRFGDFPAVTSHAVGDGRVTVVGCVPSPALASGVIRWAAPDATSHELAGETAGPVTVTSGTLPDGRRAWFAFNWGWEPQNLVLAASVTDTVTGAQLQAGTDVSLAAWSTRTFLSR
ncbi:beta-galactosidase [Agromyces sp. CF514]|uniref:beta-galactosidase n=1 Tax=Agromyces sp. CF514 TaxID=1881031 RepID=UPI0008DF6174|nr:beta-galactosidase [Agromyces sp. CF514]SFR70454.1 beta-galactosidase [Agromyces sp. CF514]